MFVWILKWCSVYLWGLCCYAHSSDDSPSGETVILRKYTIKLPFRCLIAIWSTGITKRGLNELICVKSSNSTKIDFFTFYFIFDCSSKSLCAFTLILPAWVTYNFIKPQRSNNNNNNNNVLHLVVGRYRR